MKNYVKSSNNNIVFSFDESKQRYTGEISFTNILNDKQVLTKCYLNDITKYSVKPSVLYLFPGETRNFSIERSSLEVDNVKQESKDKLVTISVPIDIPVTSYEQAKSQFKTIEYKTNGQLIKYSIEYKIKTISFNSISEVPNRSKKRLELVKKELEIIEKQIEEKEKAIRHMEYKMNSSKTNNKTIVYEANMIRKKHNSLTSIRLSSFAVIFLALLFLILGASMN